MRFIEDSTSTVLQGAFLVVQWLGLCTSTARDPGSTPDQGSRIPHAEAKKNKNKNH